MSYIQVLGTRIVAALNTDGPMPDGWIDAGQWPGFSARPAPGWQPHWVNGAVEWRDESTSPQRVAAGWDEVRRRRAALLQETDWTQLPDVPPETSARWVGYRQALRDVTLQPSPFSVVWPTPPA